MAQNVQGSNQNSNPLVDALLMALSKPDMPKSNSMDGMGSVGDLRPITVTAPKAIPQTPIQPQVAPVQQPFVPPTPAQQPVTQAAPQGGGFDLKGFLSAMGIPLASTALGLAVPGALAGAAGFNKGYGDQTQLNQKYNTLIKKETVKQAAVDKRIQDKNVQRNTPTEFDIHKEARQSVNAMLANNPSSQMEMISNPNKYNSMVDDQVRVIKERIGLSSPASSQVKKESAAVKTDDRQQKAVQYLQSQGQAVTDANIKFVMDKI